MHSFHAMRLSLQFYITISVPVWKVGHIRLDTLTQRNLQRVLRSLLLVYKYGPQTTSPLQR